MNMDNSYIVLLKSDDCSSVEDIIFKHSGKIVKKVLGRVVKMIVVEFDGDFNSFQEDLLKDKNVDIIQKNEQKVIIAK